MCANWCFQNGYKKVGFFWEQGLVRHRLLRLLPATAAQNSASRSSRRCRSARTRADLEAKLATMRDAGARGDRVRGLRLLDVPLRPRRSRRSTGIRPVSWAPRSCSIRTRTRGPRASRGGTASTSSARTAQNPNYNAMLERFEARFGRVSKNVVVALAYDTARCGHPRHRQRADRHPERGEGRPRADQADALHQRRPGHLHHVLAVRPPRLQGRLPHIRELRGGELHFRGYYRPQWPSNTSSPILAEHSGD